MLSWIFGTYEQDDDEKDVKTPSNAPVFTLNQDFVDRAFDRGIKITRLCSQSLVFRNRRSHEIFTIRVCPVWDMDKKQITTYVLQTKQMYHPHSRDKTVFSDWLKRAGVDVDISKDNSKITLKCQPIRSMNLDSKTFSDHYQICAIQTHEYRNKANGLRVWVLGISSSVETLKVAPVGVDNVDDSNPDDSSNEE